MRNAAAKEEVERQNGEALRLLKHYQSEVTKLRGFAVTGTKEALTRRPHHHRAADRCSHPRTQDARSPTAKPTSSPRRRTKVDAADRCMPSGCA